MDQVQSGRFMTKKFNDIITLDFIKKFINDYEVEALNKKMEVQNERRVLESFICNVRDNLICALSNNFPTIDLSGARNNFPIYYPVLDNAIVVKDILSGNFEAAKAFKWHLEFYKLHLNNHDKASVDYLFNTYFNYMKKNKAENTEEVKDIVKDIFEGINNSYLYNFRDKFIIKNNKSIDHWTNNPPSEYINVSSGGSYSDSFQVTLPIGKIVLANSKDLLETADIYDNIKRNMLYELSNLFNIDYNNYIETFNIFTESISKIIKLFFIDQKENIDKLNILSYSGEYLGYNTEIYKKSIKINLCHSAYLTIEEVGRNIETIYTVKLEKCDRIFNFNIVEDTVHYCGIGDRAGTLFNLTNSAKMSILYFTQFIDKDLDTKIEAWESEIKEKVRTAFTIK